MKHIIARWYLETLLRSIVNYETRNCFVVFGSTYCDVLSIMRHVFAVRVWGTKNLPQ